MPLLEVLNLSVKYGDLQVLFDINLSVRDGEIVSIIGANGAGKTTIIKTISGLVKSVSGEIRFLGKRLDKLPPHLVAEMGVMQVPEGRGIFPLLTVQENLEMGAYVPSARKQMRESMKKVFEMFPRLEERKSQLARTLSGGEQQMLAIGRALMGRPKLLLVDEPSLGLAPILAREVFQTIKSLNSQGTTILLVEQDVRQSLALCHRGYVLENGRIVLEGTGSALLGDERIKRAYLGL
ncbi:MAG TPA: ABC transporter ATP-binding protein [Clostridia bacterium]|nr:ABC transporter ATP-binding protein [Clostridia bacterium]